MREGAIFIMADSPEKAGKEAVRQGLVPRTVVPAEPPTAPGAARRRQPVRAAAMR